MKVIDAIVKSMEWSIKTQKSQLLHARGTASKEKVSKLYKNQVKVAENQQKLEQEKSSSNETRGTDYCSLRTRGSQQLRSRGNFFNLGLIIQKLQALRLVLKQILDDLDSLLIFQSKNYYNICEKCRKFAYDDKKNQLDISDIMDTLVESLGINQIVKSPARKGGKYHCLRIVRESSETMKQKIIDKKEGCCQSANSSDDMLSNCSERSPRLSTGTSDSFHTVGQAPNKHNATERKHNFRCELILLLSMLQEIICKIFETFSDKPWKALNPKELSTTERQVQNLREEYFRILNYATELIHGPRCQLQKFHVRKSYRRVLVKLKINILIAKKHIFQILYEMSKLKRFLGQNQTDVFKRRGNSVPDEISSVSSQVLVKIQDLCSKLRNAHTLARDPQRPGGQELYQTYDECKDQHSNIRDPADETEKAGLKIESRREVDDSSQHQTIKYNDVIKIQNQNSDSKPSSQQITENLETNKILREKEHELLKSIYQLLEDYLRKTKGMDLGKIKDFMERETLKYSKELKLCYAEKSTKLSLLNKPLEQGEEVDVDHNLNRKHGETLQDNLKDDAFKFPYKQRQFLRTSEDEVKRVKRQKSTSKYPQRGNHNKLFQKTRIFKLDPELCCKNIDETNVLEDSNPAPTHSNKSKNLTYMQNGSCSKCKTGKRDSLNRCNSVQNAYEKPEKAGNTDALQNRNADYDVTKGCDTGDKKLLQELSHLEVIKYCIQNQASNNLKLTHAKLVETASDFVPKESNFEKSAQTKETKNLNEEVRRFLNVTNRNIRSNTGNGSVDGINGFNTGHKKATEETVKEENRNLTFQRIQGHISSKLTIPQDKTRPLTKRVNMTENYKSYTPRANEILHHEGYEKNEKIEPLIEGTALTVNLQSNDFQSHGEPACWAKSKSKSENNVTPIRHRSAFHTNVAGFPGHKATIDQQKLLENRQIQKYEQTIREYQIVQDDIRRILSQNNIGAKIVSRHRREKSVKQRRKRLRPKLSGINFRRFTQSETTPLKRLYLTDEIHDLRRPAKANYKFGYSGGDNSVQPPLNLITDWSTACTIDDSRIRTAASIGQSEIFLDSSNHSNSAISCASMINLDLAEEKSSIEPSFKTKACCTNPDADYTSKKILQSCRSRISGKDQEANEEECFFDQVEEQTFKSKRQAKTEIKFPSSQVFSPNGSENKIRSRRAICKENKSQTAPGEVPLHSRFLDGNADDFNISGAEKEAFNVEIMKSSRQNYNERRNKTVGEEITTFLTFDKLINTRDNRDLDKKLDGTDKTNKKFTSSEKSRVISKQEEDTSSQNQEPAKIGKRVARTSYSAPSNGIQPKTNLSDERTATATNNEYTRAKLDATFRLNLMTTLLLDNRLIDQFHEQDRELIHFPASKPELETSRVTPDPLASFYVDCMMSKSREEDYEDTVVSTDSPQISKSWERKGDTEVRHKMYKCAEVNETKASAITQTPIINSFNHKKLEKNKKPKVQFKVRKSTISIRSPPKLKQVASLSPSNVGLTMETLYPKAQLTICYSESKKKAEELHQEAPVQFIKYHDISQGISSACVKTNDKSRGDLLDIRLPQNEKKVSKYIPLKGQQLFIDADTKEKMARIGCGKPMQLYNYNGLPLMNSRGEPLKNAYGEILVIFDRDGAPILDSNKNIIFDSGNKPSTSHKFNPHRPSRDNAFKVQLTNEQGKPLILYDEEGHPVTDERGYSLFDIDGNPLIRFDSCGRPVSDYKGNPLHTPSKRHIKKSEQITGEEEKDKEQMLASVSSQSFLPCSELVQQTASNLMSDIDTLHSLSISSIRTIDDVLAQESWSEQEAESDQIDLVSLILTNECPISSISTNGSGYGASTAQRFAVETEQPLLSSIKQQSRHQKTNYHNKSAVIESNQRPNCGRKVQKKKKEAMRDEKTFQICNENEIGLKPQPTINTKLQDMSRSRCPYFNKSVNHLQFTGENNEEEINFLRHNEHFLHAFQGQHGDQKDRRHCLYCGYRDHSESKINCEASDESSDSCLESIEIMNEVFQSTLANNFVDKRDLKVVPTIPCSLKPKYFSLLPGTDKILTEYSENMIEIFKGDP